MKYMLLIYGDESRWTEEERRDCMVRSLAVCDDLAARGQYLAASPLQPVATASTVGVRDDRVLVTDGPFAETTEQLGGYYLLDLPDLDAAIAVASGLPPAAKGTVEIRPVAPLPGLPESRSLPVDHAEPRSRAFLLLCYDDPAAWSEVGPEALRAARAEAAGLARELAEAGAYLDASPLHGVETATSVRLRGGRKLLTDGPFAETREVLGGYYAILAGSREEAVRVAARHPGARVGAVEVRPLFDVSSLRKSATAPGISVEPGLARSTG